MRNQGQDIPEWKRAKVLELSQEGLTNLVIAERLGLSRAAVSTLLKKAREDERVPLL